MSDYGKILVKLIITQMDSVQFLNSIVFGRQGGTDRQTREEQQNAFVVNVQQL